jgi:hypothetical protein
MNETIRIKNAFPQKRYHDFFIECFNCGANIETIEHLSSVFKDRKSFLRTNGIDLEDIIKNKPSFSEFEILNDKVNKLLIKQKTKKILNSLISKKYRDLVEERTFELLTEIISKGFSKDDIQERVVCNIAAFNKPSELYQALKKEFLVDWSAEYFIFKLQEQHLNASVVLNEGNKLVIQVNNFRTMRILGSFFWCISRDEDYYNHYTKNHNTLSIIFDFNREESDPLSKIAIITSMRGKVVDAYDKKDKKIDIEPFLNLPLINAKYFDFIVENYIQVGLMEKAIKLSYIEGFEEELTENCKYEYNIFYKTDKVIELLYENYLIQYAKLILDFNTNEKKYFIRRLFEMKGFSSKYYSSIAAIVIEIMNDSAFRTLFIKEIKELLKTEEEYRVCGFYKHFYGTYLFCNATKEKSVLHLEELDEAFYSLDPQTKIECIKDSYFEVRSELKRFDIKEYCDGFLFGLDYLFNNKAKEFIQEFGAEEIMPCIRNSFKNKIYREKMFNLFLIHNEENLLIAMEHYFHDLNTKFKFKFNIDTFWFLLKKVKQHNLPIIDFTCYHRILGLEDKIDNHHLLIKELNEHFDNFPYEKAKEKLKILYPNNELSGDAKETLEWQSYNIKKANLNHLLHKYMHVMSQYTVFSFKNKILDKESIQKVKKEIKQLRKVIPDSMIMDVNDYFDWRIFSLNDFTSANGFHFKKNSLYCINDFGKMFDENFVYKES